jgi:hypothetical protein
VTASVLKTQPAVLDLAELVSARHALAHRLRRWPVLLGTAILTIGLILGAARPWEAGDDPARSIRVPLEQQRFIASLNVDDKSELLVEGADAQTRNAAIPVSGLPVEHVAGFSAAGGATYDTALRCLTQAVYYEAANEPLQGRRSVAQVVLNRMRHPAYPHSVCGVVYQGAERRTGCQFSFTCDGSLLRAPAAGSWRQAEAVAKAALAGQVEPSVGTATHYHADYVLPKWAFQLGKIDQIGRHIFYRFNGNWGRAGALTARYSGREVIPALDFAALRQRLADGGSASTVPSEQFVPGLTVPPAEFDRHAANDVGGRLDTTKEWRLTIPDPTQASARYRAALAEAAPAAPAAPATSVAAKAPAAPAAAAQPVPAPTAAARDTQAKAAAPAREVALR